MRLKVSSCTPFCVAVIALSVFNLAHLDAQEQELDSVAGKVQTMGPAARVLTLEPLTTEEGRIESLLKSKKTPTVLPEDFRDMGTVQGRQIADTKTLTLRFAASAKLTRIESTPDFKVEQGGSCVEGSSHPANSTCTLLVRFTPQGAGRRTGKIAVTNTADATPLAIGIIGYGSAPTISFTPSIITTVPQTVSGTNGILSGASNLAVDGGDALYMADTGNKLVRYLNPSGTLQNITFGFTITDPQGIAVDSFDSVYVSQNNPATLLLGLSYGVSTEYSSGSTSCSYGSTCALGGAPLSDSGALAIDPTGNVFLSVYSDAYELIDTSLIYSKNYVRLADGFNYNNDSYNSPGPLAVDASDNIYAFENSNNICFLSATPSYYASADNYSHTTTVAGGRGCGFSGDGGQARSALIGKSVKQMTFDIAGNLYFSDTLNNRVRRIDGLTGIITTIAGNGVVGSAGDGGAATIAHLSSPTGVAVDSQGQVYIISSAPTSGQLVRKVGTVGAAYLGGLPVGTASTAQTVTVSNTGNSELDFLHVGFSSGNTSDFTMDVNTTTCNFTVPLASGRSCKVGFIFKPTATGSRTAVLTMTDDTIAGVNTIQVSGTGYTTATLTPASIAFTNTNVAASSAAQKATLTNTGKATMTITSIALSGPSVSSYSETTTCGTTLAVAASCTVSITFKPVSSGPHTATLTVLDNAVNAQQTVSFIGLRSRGRNESCNQDNIELCGESGGSAQFPGAQRQRNNRLAGDIERQSTAMGRQTHVERSHADRWSCSVYCPTDFEWAAHDERSLPGR